MLGGLVRVARARPFTSSRPGAERGAEARAVIQTELGYRPVRDASMTISGGRKRKRAPMVWGPEGSRPGGIVWITIRLLKLLPV